MEEARQVWAFWLSIPLLLVAAAGGAGAVPQDQQPAAYTPAEYNAYQAAANEHHPRKRVKALDNFVATYPTSALLPSVYRQYYLAYYPQKNYGKTIEYADKELGLGKQVDIGTRLEAYVVRAQAFFAGQGNESLRTPETLAKARDAATAGLATLASWQRPEQMTDEQFAMQKKSVGVLFHSIAGMADSQLKNYKSAEISYKAALALDPSDAVTHYRLGMVYLQETPPQALDGFWELSRSIALKNPREAQVRTYFRSQLLHYQQLSCEKLGDDEINELVTLSASGADLPAALSIPSADDLLIVRADTENFLPWLQEGGDHGKIMWLATCGREYSDVAVRVLEVTPSDEDNVTLRVFRAPTQEGLQTGTAPNMEVHVVGQPGAKRIQKDDFVRFTGILSAYQRTPFLLTWIAPRSIWKVSRRKRSR